MVKSSSKVDMGALGALSLDFRSCNFALSSSVSFVDLFIFAKRLKSFIFGFQKSQKHTILYKTKILQICGHKK